jgi:hypothetical protein
MADVTDGATADRAGSARTADDSARYNFVGCAVVAAVVGVALAVPARAGAVQLLVAIAVLQAVFALGWVFVLRVPGRIGALVIAAMTAAAADVTVSVWPHSGLGTLVAIFGLAMPVLFVHQLTRGAARAQVLASLGAIAVLVLAEVSPPALIQLRHEFTGGNLGGDVTSGVVVIACGALVVGFLIDLVFPSPRFDVAVPRGLLAVAGSAAVGAGLGHLTLRNSTEFVGGRTVFVGAALGAVAALLAVAAAYLEHSESGPTLAANGFARRMRPVLAVLLPVFLLAPVAYLLCLAVRA